MLAVVRLDVAEDRERERLRSPGDAARDDDGRAELAERAPNPSAIAARRPRRASGTVTRANTRGATPSVRP